MRCTRWWKTATAICGLPPMMAWPASMGSASGSGGWSRGWPTTSCCRWRRTRRTGCGSARRRATSCACRPTAAISSASTARAFPRWRAWRSVSCCPRRMAWCGSVRARRVCSGWGRGIGCVSTCPPRTRTACRTVASTTWRWRPTARSGWERRAAWRAGATVVSCRRPRCWPLRRSARCWWMQNSACGWAARQDRGGPRMRGGWNRWMPRSARARWARRTAADRGWARTTGCGRAAPASCLGWGSHHWAAPMCPGSARPWKIATAASGCWGGILGYGGCPRIGSISARLMRRRRSCRRSAGHTWIGTHRRLGWPAPMAAAGGWMARGSSGSRPAAPAPGSGAGMQWISVVRQVHWRCIAMRTTASGGEASMA